MRRVELEHVLRAASSVLGERNLLVIGSAAILGTFSESVLPAETTRSDEADLASFDDPDGAKATRIDGAIGELSPFHAAFGYYGQGVDLGTATLSPGWRDRLVRYRNRNTAPGVGLCLERHDCVASKLAAFREKDQAFAAALIDAGLVDRAVVAERIAQTPLEPRRRAHIIAWLAALPAQGAGTTISSSAESGSAGGPNQLASRDELARPDSWDPARRAVEQARRPD